ncbi:Aerobactin siderophore biosynthesis, IucA/IucC [Metarhizium guizhouense ARSEF 977]|uniref:Aerobactin siderophore biosynthesis, IucA/IucC n=1 Tax=Metarhizium guizhouense (strain ARSEF 977) TaxID=1276136 RepID=A0A0B4H626_METGA|nr:Aerobactin siderophore biosynthesis, IucA/IucC [Metarhizium guizhouense ARSEF 977]
MSVSNYAARARGETTKRLLAQLVNEGLASLDFLDESHDSATRRPRITGQRECMVLSRQAICVQMTLSFLSQLCSGNNEALQDDPGAIFEFISVWLDCNEAMMASVVQELRNSAAMLEKWMELGWQTPILDLDSSFLDWERSVVTGHPTHPFHRTCIANRLLKPVGPENLPGMLNPGISFVTVPRTSHFGISVAGSQGNTTVPCLTQHLPALLHYFPEAELIKTVPNCAVAQGAMRTVSVPGFAYDVKFSLACLVTSALRVLPCWSADAAPKLTCLLKEISPPNLWIVGEIAAVTGNQQDMAEARYMTCILRENLESRAKQNNEALILSSALMEKPTGGSRTYAEVLFDLHTTADKVRWFKSHVQHLLSLALGPLVRHQVGFEFHGQNSIVRICKRTRAINGFAIRDLAGVKLHGASLEAQGFDVTGLEASSTDDSHQVWDRVHHALIQNNIGYMMYALELERDHDGWGHRAIYQYFLRDTMLLKSFITMRLRSSLDGRFKLVDTEVPNILCKTSPWLLQISLAGSNKPHGNSIHTPAVLPVQFVQNVERFHEALAAALGNLVERWWKDVDANLPGRMPLEPRVEKLLRWIDEGSDKGLVRGYKGHQGNLRPDMLILAAEEHAVPQFRVCEINGRFPINYLHYAASAYEALASLPWRIPLLKPATDYTKLHDSLFQLFDPSVPIHLVGQTSDFPKDSPLFGLVEQRTGTRPRLVKPSSLVLIPSGSEPTGFSLYCVWGADPAVTKRPLKLITVEGRVLEEVHQVGCQLYDFELFALDPDMVRHIAMRSVNDMRSVFIAHDKRILGILRQELDALVHKHGALTLAQARILEQGMASFRLYCRAVSACASFSMLATRILESRMDTFSSRSAGRGDLEFCWAGTCPSPSGAAFSNP